MSYGEVVYFAQTWGLLFGMAVFSVAVAYALWSSSAERFRRAARAPLDAEEGNE